MDITGLVLCGGKSTRMGTDKGSLLKEGKHWAKIVAGQMLALNIPFKISINNEQVKDYSNIFYIQELIIDRMDLPGPLRGILSAHQQYPKKNWLVMACDLIDMDQETVSKILKVREEEPGYEFYVFRNGTHYEPFCGIYTASGLKKLYDLYCENLLKDFSLQHLLKIFKTYSILLKGNAPAFKNYNSL